MLRVPIHWACPGRDHGDAWFRQGRRTFRCAPRYAVLPRKSERQPANWHKLLRSRCLVSERPPGLPSAGREGRESGGAARRPVGERAQDNRPGGICSASVRGRSSEMKSADHARRRGTIKSLGRGVRPSPISTDGAPQRPSVPMQLEEERSSSLLVAGGAASPCKEKLRTNFRAFGAFRPPEGALFF